MRKKISGLLILILFLFTGCSNNYTAIPHNKFLSVFKGDKNYQIINKTESDSGIYKKSYEAGNGYISFYYLEFDNNKKAKNYMNLSYKNNSFHFKNKKDYIIAKRKLSKIYIKAIQVDNVVVIGMSNEFFDRFEVNKIFKKMGL